MTDLMLWPATDGPDVPNDEAVAVTLATEVISGAAMWLLGFRFWRPTVADIGPHAAALFDTATQAAVAGTSLAAIPLNGTRWQYGWLPTPPLIPAGRYRAAVHHPGGKYAATNGYWTTGGPGAAGISVGGGLLVAPNAAGTLQGQGLYIAGAALTYPVNQFASTNYWVDPVFTTTNPYRSGSGAMTATATLAATGSKGALGSGAMTVSGALLATGRTGRRGTGLITVTATMTGRGRDPAKMGRIHRARVGPPGTRWIVGPPTE